MTDNASTRKTPENIKVIRQLFVRTQIRPIIDPMHNEPVSPINIFAGNLLKAKNPTHNPDMLKESKLKTKSCGSLFNKISIPKPQKTIELHPAAKPSSPSVKFTELLNATIVKIANGNINSLISI